MISLFLLLTSAAFGYDAGFGAGAQYTNLNSEFRIEYRDADKTTGETYGIAARALCRYCWKVCAELGVTYNHTVHEEWTKDKWRPLLGISKLGNVWAGGGRVFGDGGSVWVRRLSRIFAEAEVTYLDFGYGDDIGAKLRIGFTL